ncbi:hypothetical protein HK098_001932 [Nowakowskiella sp. JEL0407]|nr:hypothetical protein HK098_001932 [Nowakowskiella sp. JEL0407]
MAQAEEYERVLLVIRECMVYKIPPRSTSRGYKAADWDVNQFLWKGRLRDGSTGDLFAICPYDLDGSCVEPVLDSSRYFVLKIVDPGSKKHAFIGLGFVERSFAFDFNVALQDHVRRVRNEKEPEATPSNAPKLDLSLKEGATISINIGNLSKKKKNDQSNLSDEALNNSNAGPFFIPPPPTSGSKTRSPQRTAGQDISSDFGSLQSPPTTSSNTKQQTTPVNLLDDDFGDFTAPTTNKSTSNWAKF